MLYEKYKIESSQQHKYKRQRPRNPLYRRVSRACCWIVVRKAGYQLISTKRRTTFSAFFLKLHIFLKYFLLVSTITATIKVDKYYRFHKYQSSYIQHSKLCCQKVDFS